jgi:hypothetical protein
MAKGVKALFAKVSFTAALMQHGYHPARMPAPEWPLLAFCY